MKFDDIEIHNTPRGLFAVRNLRTKTKRNKDGTMTIDYIADIAGNQDLGKEYLERLAFGLYEGFKKNIIRYTKEDMDEKEETE